jgi:hypothetical protein
MFCPACGAQVNEGDSFCSKCGKNLAAQPQGETVLYSFGPFGTGVCFSRPSFFTVIHRNDTRIVLTGQKLSGFSSFNNSLRLQVPYSAIANAEVFDYLMWKGLWIQYREAEKMREVSVMCTLTTYENIIRANEVMQAHRRH